MIILKKLADCDVIAPTAIDRPYKLEVNYKQCKFHAKY